MCWHPCAMNTIAKYDRAASNWEHRISRNGYCAAYKDFLKNNVRTSGAVLDVGTGTGTFARVWVEAGGSHDLTLLDPAWEMLAAAQANLAKIHVVPKIEQTQIENFNPEKPYNTILAAHVIEHCAAPNLALHRFANWLEPGGQLFLVVSKPHWCNWIIWLRFRHRWFNAFKVRQMAESAGLIPLETHFFSIGPTQSNEPRLPLYQTQKGNKMIVAHVHFSVVANDRQAALDALLAEIASVRAMQGCLAFMPFADPVDDTRLGVLHEWETEADFAVYGSSDAFKTLGQVLRPMMTAPPVSRRFDAELLEAVN